MTGSSSSGVTFLNAASRRMPGVVHHDVDAAERVERALHDRGAALGGGDRVGVAHRLAAGVDDLGDDLLGRGRRAAGAVDRAAEVVHHDARAAPGELERVAASETTAGAGDDRDLSVEAERIHAPETTHPCRRGRVSDSPEHRFPPSVQLRSA